MFNFLNSTTSATLGLRCMYWILSLTNIHKGDLKQYQLFMFQGAGPFSLFSERPNENDKFD